MDVGRVGPIIDDTWPKHVSMMSPIVDAGFKFLGLA